MPPHADLEHLIRRAYRLIAEYQLILQDSDSPKEKERARREVNAGWGLVQGYLEEYARVCEQNGLPFAADIAEIASLSQGGVPTGDALPDSTAGSPLPEAEPAPEPQPEHPTGALEPPSVGASANNPWRSGMFYLLVFLVVFAAIVIARAFLSGYEVITAVLAALLAVAVVGALQLRNDERLSDESFLKLMIEVFRQFPLFRPRPGAGGAERR